MPQLLAEQEGRVGGQGHLDPGDGLRRVPVVGEPLRRHLEVELRAGAGGLRGDRVRVGAQPVDAAHLDAQVLAARREDLVVEQAVARVLRERGLPDVLLAQRGQDAGHDQVGADGRGALLGVVQRGPDLGLPGIGAALGQPARRHVDLQVEAAQLGRPGGVGDRLEHVAVAHRRLGPVVDQVELDLQAHPGRSDSKRASRSIWASTSRHFCILMRYRRRSSRVKTSAGTSRPIGLSRSPVLGRLPLQARTGGRVRPGGPGTRLSRSSARR